MIESLADSIILLDHPVQDIPRLLGMGALNNPDFLPVIKNPSGHLVPQVQKKRREAWCCLLILQLSRGS